MNLSEAVLTKREKVSQSSRRDVILRLLKEAGPAGRTNLELNEVCMRFGGRLCELRKKYRIDTLCEGPGLYRYILRGLAKAQQELFPLTDLQPGTRTARNVCVPVVRSEGNELRD